MSNGSTFVRLHCWTNSVCQFDSSLSCKVCSTILPTILHLDYLFSFLRYRHYTPLGCCYATTTFEIRLYSVALEHKNDVMIGYQTSLTAHLGLVALYKPEFDNDRGVISCSEYNRTWIFME